MSHGISSRSGGDGFAEAFAQIISKNAYPLDGPLSASVILLATARGILDYSWEMQGDFGLRFSAASHEATEAPSGSVLIVPESSAGALLGLGVLAIAIGRRRARADRFG